MRLQVLGLVREAQQGSGTRSPLSGPGVRGGDGESVEWSRGRGRGVCRVVQLGALGGGCWQSLREAWAGRTRRAASHPRGTVPGAQRPSAEPLRLVAAPWRPRPPARRSAALVLAPRALPCVSVLRLLSQRRGPRQAAHCPLFTLSTESAHFSYSASFRGGVEAKQSRRPTASSSVLVRTRQ